MNSLRFQCFAGVWASCVHLGVKHKTATVKMTLAVLQCSWLCAAASVSPRQWRLLCVSSVHATPQPQRKTESRRAKMKSYTYAKRRCQHVRAERQSDVKNLIIWNKNTKLFLWNRMLTGPTQFKTITAFLHMAARESGSPTSARITSTSVWSSGLPVNTNTPEQRSNTWV